jgi:hypothetical protein
MQDTPKGTIIRENALWVLDEHGRFDLVENWFGFMARDTELLAEQGRTLTYFSHFPGERSPQAKREVLRELLACATANVGLMKQALAVRLQRDDPSTHLQAYERARERAKQSAESLLENVEFIDSLVNLSCGDD